MLCLFCQLLAASKSVGRTGVCPDIVGGKLQVGVDLVPVESVLFDSEVLHGSYIAKEWLDQRRDMLRHYLRRAIGMARIRDNQTLVPILEILCAEMVFTCTLKCYTTRGIVEIAVLPMNQ